MLLVQMLVLLLVRVLVQLMVQELVDFSWWWSQRVLVGKMGQVFMIVM